MNIPGQAIINGDAVIIVDGRSIFSELQAVLSIEYYASDLLYFDGYDLRATPFRIAQLGIERRLCQVLSSLRPKNCALHVAAYGERDVTGPKFVD